MPQVWEIIFSCTMNYFIGIMNTLTCSLIWRVVQCRQHSNNFSSLLYMYMYVHMCCAVFQAYNTSLNGIIAVRDRHAPFDFELGRGRAQDVLIARHALPSYPSTHYSRSRPGADVCQEIWRGDEGRRWPKLVDWLTLWVLKVHDIQHKQGTNKLRCHHCLATES